LTKQRESHTAWIEDTRRFWDTENDFDARYRRICSDPQIDACTDEKLLKSLWAKRTEEDLRQLLLDVPIERDWVCLEIGCGIGRLLAPVAARCRRAGGVDISPTMVAHAQRHLRDTPNVEVLVNDGCSLPDIESRSIDWVYSHLAFQHITRRDVVEGYLCEIARVLKPGGYCRIQCWREAPMPFAEKLKNLVRPILGKPQYHGPRQWLWGPGREVRFGGVTFHPGQWRRMLRAHGLELTSMQTGLGHDYWMWTTSRRRE
jgi:SAM-dependent methyltransferase